MYAPNPLSGLGVAALLLCSGLPLIAEDRPRLRPIPDTGKNLKTGPEVGQKIPPLALRDQTGQIKSFDSLRGPKGLILAFVRSADW